MKAKRRETSVRSSEGWEGSED